MANIRTVTTPNAGEGVEAGTWHVSCHLSVTGESSVKIVEDSDSEPEDVHFDAF